MEASVSGFMYCARAEFIIPSVNKTRNMAADVSGKCSGFFLVYSTIFFYFEALQFGKFTSSWTPFLAQEFLRDEGKATFC